MDNLSPNEQYNNLKLRLERTEKNIKYMSDFGKRNRTLNNIIKMSEELEEMESMGFDKLNYNCD